MCKEVEIWVLILLLCLVYHQAQSQKEIFTKEVVSLGNYLSFNAWARRHAADKREIITFFFPFGASNPPQLGLFLGSLSV